MDLSDNMLPDINGIHLRTWEQSSVIWPGFYKKKSGNTVKTCYFFYQRIGGFFCLKITEESSRN